RRTRGCVTRLLRAARSRTRIRARAPPPTGHRVVRGPTRRFRRRTSRRGTAARRIDEARPRRAPSPRQAEISPASSVVRDSVGRVIHVTPYNLHASALWFADRQHGGVWPLVISDDGGLGPSREPAGAPSAHTITLARASTTVK